MRVKVESGALATALRSSVAVRKSPTPIYSHVLLEAAGESLRITTSDSEATVTAVVPCVVEREGAICAPDDLLKAAMIGGGAVALTADDSLTVQRGRSRVRIPTLPAGDYPRNERLIWTDIDVPAERLAKAVDAVAHAANRTDARLWAQCILLRSGCVVATDGMRIGRAEIPYEGPDLLVPARNLGPLQRLLGEGARVQFGRPAEGQPPAVIAAQDASGDRAEVRLFAVGFPDVTAVFPIGDPACSFTVDRERLQHALDRMTPFCTITSTVAGKAHSYAAGVVRAGDGCVHLEAARNDSLEDLTPLLEGELAGSAAAGIRVEHLGDVLAAAETASMRISLHPGVSGAAARWYCEPIGDQRGADYVLVPVQI